ncbi:DUF3844 domain-containing protein [Mycena kentingensis (nom. inval.)]|nr:DUF3844 domain-containing protein [Mycena kentingensis (nom. inval.)]
MHTFPPEIVLEITALLGHAGQTHLRSTCRYMCAATAPLWFRNFYISFDDLCGPRDLSILRNIASDSQNCGWAVYARHLVVRGSDPSKRENTHARPDGNAYKRALTRQALLVATLAKLPKIRSLEWTLGETEPGWFIRHVWTAANALESLSDLSLTVYGNGLTYDLTPMRLARLKIVVLQPRFLCLERMALEYNPGALSQSTPSPLPEQMTRTFGSNTLAVLHLSGVKNIGGVWDTLAASGLRLRELCSENQAVTRLLLDYIASYSGLEKLRLDKPSGPGLDALAMQLYSPQILGRHSKSLEELYCDAGTTSKWCFGVHNAEFVSSLTKLRHLEVAVAPDSPNDIKLFFSTFTQLPALRRVALYAAAPADDPALYGTGIPSWNRYTLRDGVRFRANLCRLNVVSIGWDVVADAQEDAASLDNGSAAWSATLYRRTVPVAVPGILEFIMYAPADGADRPKTVKRTPKRTSGRSARRVK